MSEIEAYADYLGQSRIPIRLSSKTESGWPIVLSLWFMYRGGLLYCATQQDARIVRYLEKEPRCGYEIAADLPPYCGIRGQAKAHIDRKIGLEVLEDLLIRYLGGLNNPLAERLLENAIDEVALVLTPINCFQWDFSKRMAGVAPDMINLIEKSCPG
jgi:hypothetical protein